MKFLKQAVFISSLLLLGCSSVAEHANEPISEHGNDEYLVSNRH